MQFLIPKSFLVAGVLAVLVVANLSYAATENKPLEAVSPKLAGATADECASKKLPPWPLELIGKQEREARLRFFLNQYTFKVKEQNTGNNALCAPLLQRLRNIDEIKVLESAPSGPRSAACRNIQDMTLYRSYDGKVRPALLPDKTSTSYPSAAENEKNADFFYRQTDKRYTEYYDLSKFFGPNSWGMLGEAVAIQYHPSLVQKMCLKGWDAYIQAGILGRVMNSDTCSAYFLPIWAVGGQRLMGDGERHDSTPSFAAFIELDNKPYAFLFASSQVWNNFSYTSAPIGALPQIILTPLLNPKEVVQSISATGSCLYEGSKATE